QFLLRRRRQVPRLHPHKLRPLQRHGQAVLIQAQLKHEKDPKAEKTLANFAELYIPVVKYNLPQAIEAFFRGYYDFTRYALYDAANQAGACEDKLSGADGGDLSARNKVVGVGSGLVWLG
ncbi:unnamed protein product, partial [Linum tenue]